jgi:hypothetical protein
MGGRYKLGGHVSLLTEFQYNATPVRSADSFNYFGIGLNWEVTDLILQFSLSNSPYMNEDGYMLQTRQNFNFQDGNLYVGFGTIWVFHLKKNKQTLLE